MTLAPIVLFVYNRPSHTRQTVVALQRNELADLSHLIIYSDAPKSEEATASVEQVRKFIRNITGFKQLTVVEREKNWGLADSIIDGVTSTVNQYEKVIVLEDDIVTSPYFLKYMNDALCYYNKQDKVMHISGWNYPINTTDLNETFFLRGASCWGWATWKRAWQFFEKNPQKIVESFTKLDRYKFDYDNSIDMWSQVTDNLTGRKSTWAIFWYASVFKKGGLCLHPSTSLVENVGNDGSGENCGKTDLYMTVLYDKPVTHFLSNPVEDVVAMDRIKSFLFSNKKTLLERALNKIFKVLGITNETN